MPLKKKRVQSAEATQSSVSEQAMSDSDSGSSMDPDMEIMVDFEACSISEGDFHGIRNLLKQAFLGSSVDVSGLTDIVIKQADLVGSSIKVPDDEDEDSDIADSAEESERELPVYGVTSLISLDFYKDKAFVRQLRELLLTQCQSRADSLLSVLKSVLSQSVGLLIYERLINIPSEIGPPLLNSLMSEVREAAQKHHTQFACKYYVLVTRTHLEPAQSRKRKHKGMSNGSGASNCAPVFDYAECEILQKESLLSFDYPVREEENAKVQDGSAAEHYRNVTVFEVNQFEKAVLNL